VTIRTREEDAPSGFSPARLFLDDIEQIVRILVEATENAKEKWTQPGVDAKTSVTLAINDQICDEVEELPKVAMRTTNLSIRVVVPKSLPETSLTFGKQSNWLRLVGFTREQEFAIYYKLLPIFKRRNRWWGTVVRTHRTLLLTLLVLMNIALFLIPRKHAPTWLVLGIGIPGMLLSVAFLAAIWSHTIIILRHSSQRSTLRQEMMSKAIPIAVGCILSFILGLLTLYLKHKYWP
jgi:hypothetical protein